MTEAQDRALAEATLDALDAALAGLVAARRLLIAAMGPTAVPEPATAPVEAEPVEVEGVCRHPRVMIMDTFGGVQQLCEDCGETL